MMDRGNEVATATPATDIQQNVTSVSKERARIGRNEAAITETAANLDQNVITLPEERARIGRNEAAITETAANLDQNIITLPEERARIGRNEAAITEPATNLDQNVITLPEDYSPPFSLQSDAAFNASIMNECSTPVRKEEDTDTIPFKLRTELFPESPIPRSDSEEPIQAIDSSYHEAEESKNPGFCIVWDNVQLLSTTRHHASEKQNKMLLWALSFAARNRIGFLHLTDQTKTRAQDMPLHLFLPNDEDYEEFKSRMMIIVMRLLKDHIPRFKHCQVNQHIQHDYSPESAQTTRIINLGVIDANPSSVPGTIEIMETLHKYVPVCENGELFTIPTHGDGLSVERMRDAKTARAASMNASDRLEGLEPVPQEFHKRVLLMQDTYNTFFKPDSGIDRGTLFHIKNAFGHRNVSSNVMNSFNYNADLLNLTTRGLTTVLGLELLDQMTKTCGNDDDPDDDTLLKSISEKIVNTVWEQVPARDIEDVMDWVPDEDNDEDDFYEFCYCKEDIEEEMIKCSNPNCLNGLWFHLSCMNVENTENMDNKDWWCSEECRETKKSIFCLCKKFKDGEVEVKCTRGKYCKGYKIYHLSCLKLDNKPGGRWVCKHCESTKSQKKEDYIYNYSCSLLFHGLKDLTEKDCLRENDGLAILMDWKIDMPQIWRNGHNKYLIIGHKLLADVQGFQPERIRQEIIWNRTANLHGGMGQNIPLDLVNEFLNRDFKENLKRSRGQYTQVNVARTSQFVGTLGRDLDRVFQTKVCDTWVSRHTSGEVDYSNDVDKFVRIYNDDKLLTYSPGREHASFPGFKASVGIARPGKLKQRLKKYSHKLDLSREILP